MGKTLEEFEQVTFQNLIFGHSDSLARTLVPQESRKDLTEKNPECFGKCIDCSKTKKKVIDPNSCSLKTLQTFYESMEDGISLKYSIRWGNSGTISPNMSCSTPKISGFHYIVKEYSLQDVLEINVPRNHYLSDKMVECLNRHKTKQAAKGNSFGWNPITRDSQYVRSLKKNYWKIQGDADFIIESDGIRKLTPLECWRLQGVPDEITQKVMNAKISNTQMYIAAGDAVSVPVAKEMGKRLQQLFEQLRGSVSA